LAGEQEQGTHRHPAIPLLHPLLPLRRILLRKISRLSQQDPCQPERPETTECFQMVAKARVTIADSANARTVQENAQFLKTSSRKDIFKKHAHSMGRRVEAMVRVSCGMLHSQYCQSPERST